MAPPEPLTVAREGRWTYFPIEHLDLHEMAQSAAASMWVASEIDLEDDAKQFKTLEPQTQFYLSMVLSFFSCADGLINQNLMEQFLQEVQCKEAKAFWSYQVCIEQVHNEVYSKLIDKLLTQDQKEKAFSALTEYPCIKAKCDWCLQYTNPETQPLGVRLVAFAICEGLFFAASFASVFYLKMMSGLSMQGLSQANEFISRDETLHYEFGIQLYNHHIQEKASEATLLDMLTSAVDTEKTFVQTSLPVDLIGMNSAHMCEYVEFTANRIAKALKLRTVPYPQAKMPFSFMHAISLGTPKSNFFEKRDTGYCKFKRSNRVEFDADF